MDNLMSEFTGFMQENEGNPELKNTFDDMMKTMVSKEALYPPMKQLKEEFPKWLEENADKLEVEELENYNAQLDALEVLVKRFEDEKEPEGEEIIELLNKLQALGKPPDDLMKKLGMGMPGMDMMGGMPGMPPMGGMPGMPGMGFPGM